MSITNPTIILDCQQCCVDLNFLDDDLIACELVGCSTLENCFTIFNLVTQEDQRNACEAGRDLRFTGVTDKSLEGPKSCSAGIISDFDVTDFSIIQEANNNVECVSCCNSLDLNFDPLDIFDAESCIQQCGERSNCFFQGISNKRLGCTVSLDFLSSGNTLFLSDANGITNFPVNYECLNGNIVQIENINNVGNEESNSFSILVIGLMGVTSFLIIIFVVLLMRAHYEIKNLRVKVEKLYT